MNHETVTLIERPYQEIVDDILTAIVGGVVNEPIIFDIKSDLYPLSEPAQAIRGVTGTVAKKHHTFLKEIDFVFNLGNNAVEWVTNATLPDDNTTFHVDYARLSSRSPLTDINVGSVTRTLSEAIGREISTVYQQINLAYLSGFIDTAAGRSLELVVSILGITRKTKDYAVGLATFFRDADSFGTITIPEGLLLSTAKGEVSFETTQPRTLQQGQVRIDAPIRATDAFKGEDGQVPAGAINQVSQPIAGIQRVTNFEETFLAAEDETDVELRLRAKAALRGLGQATLAALRRVIFEGRGNLAEVWDPNSPLDHRSELGTVTLLVEAEPERFPSLNGAVQETRAAGVLATVVSRYVFFKPRIFATITPNLTAPGKLKVADDIMAALQTYVDGLGSGDPAEGAALLQAITSVDDVGAATIVDVMVWRSDLGKPAGETLVDALVTAVEGSTPENLHEILSNALAETPPLVPTSTRIPDRSLLQNAEGQPASDEQIEAGEFQIAAQVDGTDWWVVLDIEAADIVLQEQLQES